MRLRTPYGYKNIEDIFVGDELLAYDEDTGITISNFLISKERLSPKTDPDFKEHHGEFIFYLINGTYKLFKNQSIPTKQSGITHAKLLQIGDIIYDEDRQEVVITSIEETSPDETWWLIRVDGDHVYIADGLIVHNASRFWVGGGSNANWNATSNTNWSGTSGGAGNASVPTSTDDVTFDGAGASGNSNSTISATINVLSLTITSGYTQTMTHNAALTISGNLTLNTSYTIAGSSSITINATSTITSGGKTWPNAMTWSLSSTKTLSGNFTISGLLTISSTTTLTPTAAETLTLSGGITVSANISGTVKIILTGGTWSGGSPSQIQTDLDLQGNVTISGTVNFGEKTITYISGTITTTGSTIRVISAASTVFNTNGITWNNFSCSTSGGQVNMTLTSNLTISGLLLLNAGAGVTINKTTAETVTISGGITVTSATQGTADFYLTGGTWTGGSVTGLSNNTFLQGNVTISGTVQYKTGTLTYNSGTITVTSSILLLTSDCTLSTNGMSWETVNMANSSSVLTITINSLLSSTTLNLQINPTTFTGSAGWTVGTLVSSHVTTAAVTLKESITYTVTSYFNCSTSSNGASLTFISAHATTKTILTLQNGAACNVLANFTRIDASGGRPIRTFNGTITDCINIQEFHDLLTVAN
jgi:hypothetical protein